MSKQAASSVLAGRLHHWPPSSSSYRVRIALSLKGVRPEEVVSVNLRTGEQNAVDYIAIAPQGLVPALEMPAATLTQSLAIIEWLEDTYPEPALLPQDPIDRAKVRAFALAIACDIHPLNNPRVLEYLKRNFDRSQDETNAWYRHWVETGLAACERMVIEGRPAGQRFCFGASPGLADICLVPQLFNARRFGYDLSICPTLVAIDAECAQLPAFINAHPDTPFALQAAP